MNSTSFSRVLARSGLILIALFLVVVLFDVLPLKLLQPDWILNFAVTLSNTISIPFVGVLLINLANYVAPKEHIKLQLRIARFSALLALLFLLIQPMLAFAVYRNIRDLADYNKQQITIIQNKGSQLIQTIRNSATFEELQANMAQLQGPAIPDQARSIGLPTLKKQVLEAVRAAQESFPGRLNTPTSPAYKEVYKRIARTSAISIVATIGFGLLAWNPITDKNIVLHYLQSIGIFGITPASIYKSLKSMLSGYRMKRSQEAKSKDNRKSALYHQRQLRKIESQQLREQKQRQLAERKHAEKMRRERELQQEIERKMERKRELERERDKQ
ncbi:MAG: hypothetical protein VKO39_09855 [Cyanobacteriota bacterium]|nr:hypothetical protein [Cyanobacteriota bacterium]